MKMPTTKTYSVNIHSIIIVMITKFKTEWKITEQHSTQNFTINNLSSRHKTDNDWLLHLQRTCWRRRTPPPPTFCRRRRRRPRLIGAPPPPAENTRRAAADCVKPAQTTTSNPRLLDRKSDALPLSHRATPVFQLCCVEGSIVSCVYACVCLFLSVFSCLSHYERTLLLKL